MDDLTIIMCTAQRVPAEWAAYHRDCLLEAAAGAAIITSAPAPLDWGKINLRQENYGLTNLYRQVLRGVELAETEFVAVADDDTLYPRSHFEFRPETEVFYYNFNRWHLFSWGPPFFFHKPRPGGGLLVARRELARAALAARFTYLNEVGELPGRYLHELGEEGSREADVAAWREFYSEEPVVSFYHEGSVQPLAKKRKIRAWPVRALELPYWGRAEEVRRRWR